MAGMRTSSDLELLIPLQRDEAQPLHRQLEEGLREAIRGGRLAPGAAVPSTRALARQLDVSRGIVVEAYEQLIAEGYLLSRPGGATRVASTAIATPVARGADEVGRSVDIEFRSGRPDLNLFPRQAWHRSVRRVLNEAPAERLGYLDGRGVPELRSSLASYLNRVRGTAARPDNVVVSSGFVQGLRLVAEALCARGSRRIGLEDPGHAEARTIAERAGLEVVGIPVDESGLRVDALETAGVDIVLVTAAHQYPTGGVLPPDRRAALIAWASDGPRVVIEDDYDAEFRYDREPIGSLQGLAPECVVYAGSASKVLAPGFRLGWIVAPASLADAVAQAKLWADHGSPALEQLAFADFLEHGELDRHLRRMRPIYRRRRDALLEALRRHLPELRPAGASAGLHVLAWLPPDVDETRVVEAARGAGIAIEGLSRRMIRPQNVGGLVFGYGTPDEATIERGVRRLADVIATVRSGPA